MPRRRCCGIVDDLPLCRKFLPQVSFNYEAVQVRLEELEAIRLKDLEELDQSDCADKMGLTRPTFQRILQSARVKVAKALVEGRAIIIEGGNYVMKNREFECVACHHVWEEAPCTEGGKHGYELPCPKCGSMQKLKLEGGVKHVCGGGGGHRHGGGGCCGGHR